MRRQLAIAILTLGLCGAFFLSCTSAPKVVPAPCATIKTSIVKPEVSVPPSPSLHMPSPQGESITITEDEILSGERAKAKQQSYILTQQIAELHKTEQSLGINSPVYAEHYLKLESSIGDLRLKQPLFNEYIAPVLQRETIRNPSTKALNEVEIIFSERAKSEGQPGQPPSNESVPPPGLPPGFR